jgi:hypothetical protein
MEYNNVLEAAKGVLLDAACILKTIGFEYIVIGGWCPFLRNQRRETPHPGTKDIDLLFQDADAPNGLKIVVESFLASGYLPSAKHQFQLLRVIRVKDQDFVFNIDLLHPSESKTNPELFVDHFEFDICENSALKSKWRMKSIVLPSSAILFKGFFSSFDFSAVRPNGDSGMVQLPLLNEAGLVLSKCQSIKTAKRDRDAFDMYLMLSQPDNSKTIFQLRTISKGNEDVRFLLNDCCNYVEGNSLIFDKNVIKFFPSDREINGEAPSRLVVNSFKQILGTATKHKKLQASR